MAKTDVWMPLFIGDYLADTSRLTTEQHGAYLLLLMDYWRNGPPPDDNDTLAQITRLSVDAWSNARAKLEQFFTVENGVWRQKRVDEEMASALENKSKASAKAKAAADARWGKDATSIAPSKTQAMPEECPLPSPSSIKTKSKAETANATRLPADWTPTLEDAEFCAKERPDLSIDGTASRFKDYWISEGSSKGRKLNWSATWRNWVRNEKVPMARGSPAKPEKFDPTAYVNRNKTKATDERTIELDLHGEPI